MIVVRRDRKGEEAIVVLCDVCREPVDPWDSGIAVSDSPDPEQDVPIHVVHKGACDRALQARTASRLRQSVELDDYLVRIGTAAGIHWLSAFQRAALSSGLVAITDARLIRALARRMTVRDGNERPL